MEFDQYIETDDAIFHYTRTAVALEHILHTRKYRLSLLKDTNDPQEYKFKLFNTIGWELDQEKTMSLSDTAQTIVDRILRYECRVMCFCSNRKPILLLDDGNTQEDEHTYSRGWSKSRMWSQYGEDHHGVCLVLSKDALRASLDERNNDLTYKADHIRYSQEDGFYHSTINFDGNRLAEEGAEQYAFNHVVENSDDFFFRKHIDYRDESEYRIVVFDTAKMTEYLDVQSSLRGVIIGDRTPEVYTPLINSLCDAIGVNARKAYWSRGESHLLLTKPQGEEKT